MPLPRDDEQDIDALIAALGHPETHVRRRAVAAIEAMGKEAARAVPHLLRSLHDTEEAVRHQAILALGRIGTPAVEGLVEALHSPSASLRATAALILGRIGPDASQAIAPLVATLGDEDAHVSDMAGSALVEIGDASVPPLIEGLQRGSPRLRCSAAEVLGLIDTTLANSAWSLFEALGDESREVRRAALGALERMPQWRLQSKHLGPGRHILQACAEDPDEDVRSRALRLLALL